MSRDKGLCYVLGDGFKGFKYSFLYLEPIAKYPSLYLLI
jgi:hypothetical protein